MQQLLNMIILGMHAQVNITAENVESVSDYMSTLVENTTRTPADQNADNSQVISNVLDKTVSLFLSQTTNLPSITEVRYMDIYIFLLHNCYSILRHWRILYKHLMH